jgi:hypothetical protein
LPECYEKLHCATWDVLNVIHEDATYAINSAARSVLLHLSRTDERRAKEAEEGRVKEAEEGRVKEAAGKKL